MDKYLPIIVGGAVLYYFVARSSKPQSSRGRGASMQAVFDEARTAPNDNRNEHQENRPGRNLGTYLSATVSSEAVFLRNNRLPQERVNPFSNIVAWQQ